MPYRIASFQPFASILGEALAMLGAGGYAVFRYVSVVMDDESWKRLKGTEGALFGAAVIVIALWLSKIADGKRLDKRHAETLALQRENAEKLMTLTADSIRMHERTCQTIASVDRTLMSFQQTNEESTEKIVAAMNGKTCHAKTIKEMFPNFPEKT